jgi:hypothetical protein
MGSNVRSTSKTWLRTLDAIVKEEHESLSFRPVPWALFLVLLAAAAVGASFFSTGGWLAAYPWQPSLLIDPDRMRESGTIMRFIGSILLACAGVLFALVIVPALWKCYQGLVVLDFTRGRVFRRGRWREEDPRALAIRVEDVARPECSRLVARPLDGSAELLLVPGLRTVWRPKLVELAGRIAELSGAMAAPGARAARTGVDPRFEALLLPSLLLTMGLAWAAVGWIGFRDAVLRMHGIGARAWPLGLWIAGLGLLEALGVSLLLPRRRARWAWVILVAWGLTYVWVART